MGEGDEEEKKKKKAYRVAHKHVICGTLGWKMCPWGAIRALQCFHKVSSRSSGLARVSDSWNQSPSRLSGGSPSFSSLLIWQSWISRLRRVSLSSEKVEMSSAGAAAPWQQLLQFGWQQIFHFNRTSRGQNVSVKVLGNLEISTAEDLQAAALFRWFWTSSFKL